MLLEVRNYLEQVRYHLRLDPATEKQVIGELYTYFEEKIAELQKNLSEKDAARAAIESFGRARVVARLMYEAYSQGTWLDAAMAGLPCFLMAGLFAFNLWHHIILAPAVAGFIILVTLFGWWHGKPNWLYSWIGFALAPLFVGGYISGTVIAQAVSFFTRGTGQLPDIWLFIIIEALAVASLSIIVRTTVRVVKRDWILASLMLVSLPILGSWLFNLQQVGGLLQADSAVLHQWDGAMASAMAVLGVTAATFIRLRRRVLKAGAVIIIGSMSLAAVGHNLWGGLGFFGQLGLFILMLGFLLTPTLLEKRVGHGEEPPDIALVSQEQSSAK